nr:hypothetical protein GCM10010200_098130 [Actinomadura rugatobispora]
MVVAGAVYFGDQYRDRTASRTACDEAFAAIAAFERDRSRSDAAASVAASQLATQLRAMAQNVPDDNVSVALGNFGQVVRTSSTSESAWAGYYASVVKYCAEVGSTPSG